MEQSDGQRFTEKRIDAKFEARETLVPTREDKPGDEVAGRGHL